MNRKQSNFMHMAKSALVTFQKHESAWIEEPLVIEELTRVSKLIEQIDKEAVRQKENETPGFTAAKDQQRDALEDWLFLVGGRLKVFAAKNGDRLTAEKVRFSQTKLGKMPLNDLLATARTTADAAENLLEELAAYKVTQSEVDALRELANKTDLLYSQRDAARGEHSENTFRLTELIEQLRVELQLLDTLLEAYIEDEEFLGAYFFARRIYDVRGGSARTTEEEN
jgi:hypothetical protein